LARRTGKHTNQNKSADNYSTAERNFTRNLKAINDENTVIKKSKSVPDLGADLSLMLNRHDERFMNYVKLMERYNQEKIRIEMLKINTRGKSGLVKKPDSLLRRIIKKIFRIKDNAVSEKNVDLLNDDSDNINDPEFQNFVVLMQRHEESYKNFQKLVTVDPDQNKDAEESSKIKALRLKHLEMTNLIKSDVDMLEL